MRLNRSHIAFVHDLVMAAASFGIALFLRLGERLATYPTEQLILGTVMFTVVAALVFWSMRMYRGVWRYASLNDLIGITKSASLVILIFLILMFQITRLSDLPRSLPFINWFVLMALLGGPRFLYRLAKDRRFDFTLERGDTKRIPVLLAGAEDGAEMFVRAMSRHDSNYRVVGILANSPGRVGRKIHGVDIQGTVGEAFSVIENLVAAGREPRRLIVTSDKIDGPIMANLLDVAEQHGMTLARLPALTEFKKNTGQEVEVRPVDVEDLLGRPQTPLDRPAMKELIAGRRVLITGAGGSIGSEMARQIADLGPDHLTLLDNSEYNLFTIDRQLAGRSAGIARHAVIADVRDRRRLSAIFTQARPELVFHAAALKHVPLVESNMFEGIATNVLGTVNVADAGKAAGAGVLVLISTDKAVNPTSIMGASKRIAESYCQALDLEHAGEPGTRFVTVRFGNVLGSTGSVVELFRDQLAHGHPLSVTHPDMTRYFMTTREAVELVLQASALGSRAGAGEGGILVLDMGQPVRIMDLAKQMIRLAGKEPGKDVKIEIIGPRPGEKLFEETLYGDETLLPTACQGILLAAPQASPLAQVSAGIEQLSKAIAAGDEKRLLEAIRAMVPEYHPPQYDAPKSSPTE